MVQIPSAVAGRVIYVALVAVVILFFIGLSAKIRYSRSIEILILDASQRESVHPRLLAAVIWKESRFQPNAMGEAGEVGLMQVSSGAAEDWAQAMGRDPIPMEALSHPGTNITVGAWYLARAIRHWKDEQCQDPLPFALAEYNAGRSTVSGWVENGGKKKDDFLQAITFPGTRQYVEEILHRFRKGTS